jgi:putative oxidoreductase
MAVPTSEPAECSTAVVDNSVRLPAAPMPARVIFAQKTNAMLLNSEPINEDLGYLFLRLGAGGALIYQHGWPKLMGFAERMDTFADPLGIGSGVSLALITFAETICAALVMLGLWTRIATLPILIGFAVVVFVVQGDAPFKEKELAMFFLVAYLTILFTGSGRYSVDRISFR